MEDDTGGLFSSPMHKDLKWEALFLIIVEIIAIYLLFTNGYTIGTFVEGDNEQLFATWSITKYWSYLNAFCNSLSGLTRFFTSFY